MPLPFVELITVIVTRQSCFGFNYFIIEKLMSLMKKTRNDAIKAAVTSYLERRNYPVSKK